MLYVWLVCLVVCVFVLSRITNSKINVFGGGFILSIFIMIAVYTFTGGAKEQATKEIKRQAQAKIEAAKAKEARRAAAEKKKAEEYEKCKTDSICWGNKHSLAATYKCQDAVERFAKYDFKWTDGVLGSKLTKVRWKNKDELTLTYSGDKIQFQNGFGAWQNMIYKCGYDPTNDKLLSVDVKPGRF